MCKSVRSTHGCSQCALRMNQGRTFLLACATPSTVWKPPSTSFLMSFSLIPSPCGGGEGGRRVWELSQSVPAQRAERVEWRLHNTHTAHTHRQRTHGWDLGWA